MAGEDEVSLATEKPQPQGKGRFPLERIPFPEVLDLSATRIVGAADFLLFSASVKKWNSIETDHIGKRAAQRGFTIEQALLTISEPTSISKAPVKYGNHGGLIWLFFRAFDGRVLVVVAETKKDACWLVTGYWS